MLSLESRFAEAMGALKLAGCTKKFDEASKTCTTIEQKLNAAESVLKAARIVRESRPPIRMHAGAGDRFVEGNPLGRKVEELRESANNFSPGYIKETTDIFAESDKVIADWMLEKGQITEAQHRKLTGQKPEAYEKLSEQGRKDYDFAVAVGISEADALKLVKMSGSTFREVSRR